MSFDKYATWRGHCEDIMFKNYVISLADAGIDDEYLLSFYNDNLTPEEFVSIFANKFDLVAISSVHNWGTA